MKANKGDVFCTYNKKLMKYIACQVTKLETINDTEYAVVLWLDWSGENTLTEADFPCLKPLYLDFHFHKGEMELDNVENIIPLGFIYIGNAKPLTDKSTNTFCSWESRNSIYRQMLWNEIPIEKRKQFKDACKNDNTIMLTDKNPKISMRHADDVTYPIKKLSEFNVLPCLSYLRLKKYYDDFEEFIKNHYFLTELTLKNHKQEKLDLRDSSIDKLMLDMEGVKKLYLNDNLEQILFQDTPSDSCEIFARGDGEYLNLTFQKDFISYPTLKNLNTLHGWKIKKIDIADILNAYPNLEEIRLWGDLGIIENLSLIKEFKQLKRFTLYDLFGFSANDIPKPEELPHLTWFWLTSIPEDAAKEAKKLYKKRKIEGLDFQVTQSRKDDWITQNLNNPFRHWDGDDHILPSVAKKAANLYKNAHKQMLALKKIDGDVTVQVKEIIGEFITALNKLDKKQNFETTERDDVCIVVHKLYNLLDDSRFDILEVDKHFDNIIDF